MGKLIEKLNATGGDLKQSRIDSLHSDIKREYKRLIEDGEVGLKRIAQRQEDRLDFGSTEGGSVIRPESFNIVGFIESDSKDTVDLYCKRLSLEEIKKRYKELFGEE